MKKKFVSGDVWPNKTSLAPPPFIEVPVPRQECEQSCICTLWVSILPLSTILLLDFGTVPTVWYYCFSRFWNCTDSLVLLFF